MRIVTGFINSEEGRAALDRAIDEARLRDAELVVVHAGRPSEPEGQPGEIDRREGFWRLEHRLAQEGIRYRLRELISDQSPAEELLEASREEDAGLIVIGVRRRSPVGKLVLGSNAQDVLLRADCPVLAVKAPAETA